MAKVTKTIQDLAAHTHVPGDITGTAVVTNDARLSDARTPSAHGHAPGDVTGTAVVTGDSRLSDARTPTSHGHAPSEVTGTAVVTNDARLSDARTPTSHGHAPGDVTGTAVVTNDSRLSDARTPTSHNHAGSDINSGSIDGDRLPALSQTKKGGAPATGTPSGKFLKDDGTWDTPAGSVVGYVLNLLALVLSTLTDAATYYFGGTCVAPDTTAATKCVYVPKAGTIKAAYVFMFCGTVGTNENISVYIRKNNTTDTLIATLGIASASRVFSNTGLSIAVAQGDYIEIKVVCPTWATNPATARFGGAIYIE